MASWIVTEEPLVTEYPSEDQRLQERSLIENKNALNVLAKLKEFHEKKILCDLVFQVNKTSFPVHKAVLAAWSPKVANLILSHTDAKTDLVCFISYNNTDVFAEFIEFCYSGFVSPTERNVHSFLDIGRNFFVESLVSACEDYLRCSISSVNYVSRFITSVKYSLASLEETVISFIETNLANIVDQHELLNLRPQDLELFLSSGRMGNVKPEVKLSLIISWVSFSPLDRNKFVFYLLSQISWDHTAVDLLIQIGSTENIFTSSEFCLFQLLQCVVYSTGYQLGPFTNTYTRLYAMYSHMLEELSLPKAFSTSSSRIEDILNIPVSVVSQTEPVSKKKDAEMNTDVDSSYFQDSSATLVQDSSEDICAEASQVTETDSTNLVFNSEKEERIDNETGPTCKTDDITKEIDQDIEAVNQEKVPDAVCENSPPTHRRKGRPRKITIQEPRTKRGRGRPKKNNNKENTNTIDEKGIPPNTAQDSSGLNGNNFCNDSPKESNGEPEREAEIDTQETDSNNISDSIVKVVIDDTENNESSTVETKPRVKLNLKLKCLKSSKSKAKAKYKAGNIKASKNSSIKVNKSKSNQVFKCSYENCSYTSTKSEYRLALHVENVHNIDVRLECRKCEFTTNQMRELCLHLKTHYKKTPYQCDEEGCGKKYLSMCLLVRHQMSHMNEKPYKCDLCNKSFGTLNQLRCHKKLHEGRQFECDICLKKFTTKGVMQSHRVIHFDKKEYLCDTCGFCTKHLSHLISHRKIHTGDVLHCTFPDCNYSSPKQAHMTQHINRHLNIRNHICQVCGKSFVVRSKLLRHERIHLKDKLFKCKQCDYQTSRLDRMKLHIESHGIKFKKIKKNLPIEDESSKPEIDFHQLYERVQPGSSNSGLTGLTLTSMAEMKSMDAISLAASASMIVDSYSTPRLLMDSLSGEAVTTIDESLTFQQGFERIHAASFDQL